MLELAGKTQHMYLLTPDREYKHHPSTTCANEFYWGYFREILVKGYLKEQKQLRESCSSSKPFPAWGTAHKSWETWSMLHSLKADLQETELVPGNSDLNVFQDASLVFASSRQLV